MAEIKKIGVGFTETAITSYVIIGRNIDDYLLNDANGVFDSSSPSDPYISLTENLIRKGLYELEESRTVWDNGSYTTIAYKQDSTSPNPSLDKVIGQGDIFIRDDLIIELNDNVNSIKVKTDNLPVDPASETNVDATEVKVDTLLSRLTTTRAGYLDNLSGGAVALEATLTAMKGAGWSTETLKAIKDAIDALNNVSVSAVADAVWDEAILDHTDSTSFGAKNQLVVPSETINDYKADVSALSTSAELSTHDGKLDIVDSNIDTLLSRLTALRAGYLDNLSAGAVALQSTLTSVQSAIAALNDISVIEIDTQLSGSHGAGSWLSGDIGNVELDDTDTNKQVIAKALKDQDVSTISEVTGSVYKALNDALVIIKTIETGRWKILNNQMVFYDTDNTTPLYTFDLKDSSGNPTENNPVERVPE